MKVCVAACLALSLCACAGVSPKSPAESLFADHLFGERPQLTPADQVFALDDAMLAFLDDEAAAHIRLKGPRVGLAEALSMSLKVEYDTALTRTASQAFEARAGNCLSLVILSAALARQLDIPVVYQSVYGHDTWSRSSGIAFLSNHVNVALGIRLDPLVHRTEDRVIIDFLPRDQLRFQHVRPIGEKTVLAMFMNNRAAESLARGEAAEAYWWVREALMIDPAFVSAYNTLGVVYLRHGHLPMAEKALEYARQYEPGNAQVLTNLVKVLAAQGRVVESQHLRERLAEIEKYPPFHFLDRGLQALDAGDIDTALALFEKELERMPYDHEVHFAIARANYLRGNVQQTRSHLQLAQQNSPTRDRRDIYAAKLDHLNAQIH